MRLYRRLEVVEAQVKIFGMADMRIDIGDDISRQKHRRGIGSLGGGAPFGFGGSLAVETLHTAGIGTCQLVELGGIEFGIHTYQKRCRCRREEELAQVGGTAADLD